MHRWRKFAYVGHLRIRILHPGIYINTKNQLNIISEPSYNHYETLAQYRVRERILKKFCGFGFFTLENPQVQKISAFGQLSFEILALT